MSKDNVLHAISALYNHGDADVRKQADKWLETWRMSSEAWSAADNILHDPSSPGEAHVFAAQTLRLKAMKDFEELPAQAANALRASLLELLLAFGQGAASVKIQLCLALAAVAVHMPAAQWEGGGPVQWLVLKLQRAPQALALPCMLGVLEVLPEETEGSHVAVRPERRRQAIEELVAAGPQALQVLAACLTQDGGARKPQALKAFASWLRLKSGCLLEGAVLAQHQLTQAALQGLQSTDDAVFEAAVDAVCELIYCTSSRGEADPKMLPLVQLVVPAVMGLLPRFQAARKQAVEDAQERPTDAPLDDDEAVKGMARLFAELGESFTGLIATGTEDAMQPVQALLEVAAYPDDGICAISYTFWHRLSRRLSSGFESQEDQQAALQQLDARMQRFIPAFEQLVVLVQNRVRYPETLEKMRKDEIADFRRSRYSTADVLEDAAEVLGGPRILQQLIRPLQQAGQQVAAGGQLDWRTAESALYCIRAVCRQMPPAGDAVLLSLFSSLPSLPKQPYLQYTAAMVVAAYAKWLAQSAQAGQQHLLTQLLQMLTKALNSLESSHAAGQAICALCYACATRLTDCLAALMDLYTSVQTAGAAAPTGQSAMTEGDVKAVMEGVASVVSAAPDQPRRSAAQSMLTAVLQPLAQAAQAAQEPTSAPRKAANGSAASSRSPNDLADVYLERLTVVMKGIADPSLASAFLGQTWPLLHTILQRFKDQPRTVERCGRAIKTALQCAGKESAPLLPDVLQALAVQFAATRHCCMLYIASELLKIYGHDPAYTLPLGQLITSLVQSALSMLRQLRDFEQNPDLADDVFLLISRACRYCPRIVMTQELLPLIMDAALAGLLVQHREACVCILTAVQRMHSPDTVATCPPEAAELQRAALLPRDAALLQLLVAGVVGALPSGRFMDLADTLVDVLVFTSQQGLPWLGAAVAAIPEAVATAEDKHKVLAAAQQLLNPPEASNPRTSFDYALEDLSDVCCRNYRSLSQTLHALLPPEVCAITLAPGG